MKHWIYIASLDDRDDEKEWKIEDMLDAAATDEGYHLTHVVPVPGGVMFVMEREAS